MSRHRSSFAPVLISWASPSTGFHLQKSSDLNTANWVAPSEPGTGTGTSKFIVMALPADNRFYRLNKS